MPKQQQVVVVEHGSFLFVIHVGREEAAEVLHLLLAPREVFCDRLLHRLTGVDAAAVDIGAGALEWEAAIVLGQPQLGAQHAHEVFGIGSVEDGEGRVKPDGAAVQAEEPGGDRVKCAPPDLARGRRPRSGRGAPLRAGLGIEAPQYLIDTSQHLCGGPAGESEQQDAPRVAAHSYAVGHTMSEGSCLAGARAGDHQQGLASVKYGCPLLVVEPGKYPADGGLVRSVVDVRRWSLLSRFGRAGLTSTA